VVLVAVLGLVCLLFRRRVWAGIAAAVVAVNAVWLAPLFISDDPPRSGTRIVAMTVNLRYGFADLNRVVEEVRDREVSVLALTEVTPEAITTLNAAGLSTLLPHNAIAPGDRAHGSGLWSRWPLTRGPDWEGGVHNWPGAIARIDGQDVVLRVVHPFRISRFNSDLYRQDYRLLRARMNRLSDEGGPSLVLGDFNASRDMSAFRGLLGDRWRDAPEYAGSGLRPTWNVLLWLPPAIQLDHILMSRQFGAHSTKTFDVPGTDHDGIVADLILAPR
jgi:endonuclease/exonuclease/phosphatase family metal-dependent hydrolase